MSALVLRWCALDQSALSRVAVIVGPPGRDGDITPEVEAARDAAAASAATAVAASASFVTVVSGQAAQAAQLIITQQMLANLVAFT